LLPVGHVWWASGCVVKDKLCVVSYGTAEVKVSGAKSCPSDGI
jgi:hypothetical protein